MSCYLKVSELSDDIQLGISHVTAFNKLSGQHPGYIKRKYDHGSHMKCIATSKNVGGLQASTKKKNGERKQEGGRLQWDDDRVVEIIATDSRMSDGQDEEDQR